MQSFLAGGRLGGIFLQGFGDRARVGGLQQLLARLLGSLADGGSATRAELGECTGRCLERPTGGEQDGRVIARGDREAVFAVGDEQPAVRLVEIQLDVARLQALAIGAPEERREHAAAQGRIRRVPVDVEILGIRAGTTPFEHVEPPAVIVAANAHVVRHDVEDQAHPALAQCRDHMV